MPTVFQFFFLPFEAAAVLGGGGVGRRRGWAATGQGGGGRAAVGLGGGGLRTKITLFRRVISENLNSESLRKIGSLFYSNSTPVFKDEIRRGIRVI